MELNIFIGHQIFNNVFENDTFYQWKMFISLKYNTVKLRLYR